MKQHTKEPWAWEQFGEKDNNWHIGIAYATSDLNCRNPLAGQVESSEYDEGKADFVDLVCWKYDIALNDDGNANYGDAQRIVACVNALVGMADPEAAIAKLRQDKAELVEALQKIADGDFPSGGYTGGEISAEEERAYHYQGVAQAAIAKHGKES